MVPILARQAVIIKSLAGNGIIISNYECAYGMGLLCRLVGMEAPAWDNERPEEMLGCVLSGLGTWSADDAPSRSLLEMLRKYKPDDTLDEQVRELYQMGVKEQSLWKK